MNQTNSYHKSIYFIHADFLLWTTFDSILMYCKHSVQLKIVAM